MKKIFLIIIIIFCPKCKNINSYKSLNKNKLLQKMYNNQGANMKIYGHWTCSTSNNNSMYYGLCRKKYYETCCTKHYGTRPSNFEIDSFLENKKIEIPEITVQSYYLRTLRELFADREFKQMYQEIFSQNLEDEDNNYSQNCMNLLKEILLNKCKYEKYFKYQSQPVELDKEQYKYYNPIFVHFDIDKYYEFFKLFLEKIDFCLHTIKIKETQKEGVSNSNNNRNNNDISINHTKEIYLKNGDKYQKINVDKNESNNEEEDEGFILINMS